MEELEQFVPRSHISKDLGGDEDWTYEYLEPQPGEDSRLHDDTTKDRLLHEREKVVKEFEKATSAWIVGTRSEETRSSIGDRRDDLATSLRDGYWQLDPYLRARTVYDRAGVIKPGGQLDFYSPKGSRSEEGTDGARPTGQSCPDPLVDDID